MLICALNSHFTYWREVSAVITIKNTSNNKDLLVTAKKLVKGDPGGYYIPVVENGILKWIATDAEMKPIKETNVVGPTGPEGKAGKDGRDGIDGKNGKSGVHVGSEAPTDEDATVWIDLDGGGIDLKPAEEEEF